MFDYTTAEHALIGCLLIDDSVLPLVRPILSSGSCFSSEPCRRVYETILALTDDRKPVDPVTVGHTAGLDNNFLAQCMDAAPPCAGAEEYARTVVEGYRRRQLQALGDRLQSQAFAHDLQPEQLLLESRSTLEELTQKDADQLIKSPADSLQDFLLFRHEVNQGKRRAVKVGFPSLDGILGGFARGGLYVMAARPGVGKSALGIAMADMLAKDHRILYASLEMTAEELNARRLAAFSTASCSYGKLLFGKTTQEEDNALYEACGILHKRQLMIAAVPSMTVAELGIHAARVKAQVIILDYLGLMTGTDRRATEYERVTQVSGDLKRLAKRLNCVVLALCQLNREAANSEDLRPKLSQLRSSGAIEQDADGVLLLHRPEYGKTDRRPNPAAPEEFFVDIAKNRHGRTGTIKLDWFPPVNRFQDKSDRWEVKSWN